MKRINVDINKLKSKELICLFRQKHSKDFFPHVRSQALERALNEKRLLNYKNGIGVVVWKLCLQKSRVYNNRPGDFKMEYMVVDNFYAGKGLSGKLFKLCLELANKHQCPRLIFTVRADNRIMNGIALKKYKMTLEKTVSVKSKTTGNIIDYNCYYIIIKKNINNFFK